MARTKRGSLERPEPRNRISEQLRAVITDRKLSTYELEHQTGVSRSIIARFLTRKRDITLDSADRLIDHLGLALASTRTQIVGRGRSTAASSPARSTRPAARKAPARPRALPVEEITIDQRIPVGSNDSDSVDR